MTDGVAALPDAAWLRQGDLARLLAILSENGEEARVVGGAVRDSLLGRPVGDIDVATTATPDEVTRRVTAAGFKAVPTGIAHGTVTVVANGRPFEVTTLREDVETFGRKANVAFGRDWAGDARRRDFTFNAMSVSGDGVLHDYTGGQADLAAGRVRFIGDAGKRIAEDYLRILRFFRFHAGYGEGAPDPAGLAACIAGRDGLAIVSRERVRMEMLKLLAAPRAPVALAAMEDSGLLLRLLGGVTLSGSVARMMQAEAAFGVPPDAIRRLAALAVMTREDASRLADNLRLTRAEHDRLAAVADGWWRMTSGLDESRARRALYWLGAEAFSDQVLLAASRDARGDIESFTAPATLPKRFTPPSFPLDAAAFLARGVEKGPALGAALRKAEQDWVDADFPPDDAALTAIADRAVGKG